MTEKKKSQSFPYAKTAVTTHIFVGKDDEPWEILPSEEYPDMIEVTAPCGNCVNLDKATYLLLREHIDKFFDVYV